MVAGECARKIFKALLQLERHELDEGRASLTLVFDEQSTALRRALMRIEAELLLQDAASLGTAKEETRNDGERSFDAFELLTLRTFTALQSAEPSRPSRRLALPGL